MPTQEKPTQQNALQTFEDSVYLFNNIAGRKESGTIFSMRQQAQLIKEEVDELFEALEKRDYEGILDALCDIMVTTVGLKQQLDKSGFSTNEALLDTAKNNLTKYIPINSPDLKDIVKETERLYNAKGIAIVAVENPTYGYVVFRNAETGKVLKPAGYQSNYLGHCIPLHLRFEDKGDNQ